MSLNTIIIQAVNAQIEAFIQKLCTDIPTLNVEELRAIWEKVSESDLSDSFVGTHTKAVKNTKPAKKEKDPNAPRTMTGYMVFCQEHRNQVKVKYPDISFGQVSGKLGAMWKALSENQRKEYVEKASEIVEERKINPEKGCSYKFSKGKKIGKKCGAPVKENGLCNQHKPKPKAKTAKVVSDSDSDQEKKEIRGKINTLADKKISKPENEKISGSKRSEGSEALDPSENETEEIEEKEVSEDSEQLSDSLSEESIDSSGPLDSEPKKEIKKTKEKIEQTCMVEMKGKRKGELCGKPLVKGLSICAYHAKQKK